jgi:hypothetical protein
MKKVFQIITHQTGITMGDKSTAVNALLHMDDAGKFQIPKRFTDCAAGHGETVGQLAFCRQFVPWLKVASGYVGADLCSYFIR